MERTSIAVQPCQTGFSIQIARGAESIGETLTHRQLDTLYERGQVLAGRVALRFCAEDLVAEAPTFTAYVTMSEWWQLLLAAERKR